MPEEVNMRFLEFLLITIFSAFCQIVISKTTDQGQSFNVKMISKDSRELRSDKNEIGDNNMLNEHEALYNKGEQGYWKRLHFELSNKKSYNLLRIYKGSIWDNHLQYEIDPSITKVTWIDLFLRFIFTINCHNTNDSQFFIERLNLEINHSL